MNVKFCTDFDYSEGCVPATSFIFSSNGYNYGQPEDYSLLDVVIISQDEHLICGAVVSKNHVGNDCFIVIKPHLVTAGGMVDFHSARRYLQELSVLLGETSVLPEMG